MIREAVPGFENHDRDCDRNHDRDRETSTSAALRALLQRNGVHLGVFR